MDVLRASKDFLREGYGYPDQGQKASLCSTDPPDSRCVGFVDHLVLLGYPWQKKTNRNSVSLAARGARQLFWRTAEAPVRKSCSHATCFPARVCETYEHPAAGQKLYSQLLLQRGRSRRRSLLQGLPSVSPAAPSLGVGHITLARPMPEVASSGPRAREGWPVVPRHG